MEDRLARILNSLSERCDKWEQLSREAIKLDANFKSMESASKLAFLQAGESAVKAEAMLRSTKEWAEHYEALQLANLAVARANKSISICEKSFDAERTRQANHRGIV